MFIVYIVSSTKSTLWRWGIWICKPIWVSLATPHASGPTSPPFIVALTPGDINSLASLGNNQNYFRWGSSNFKPRPKCDHYNRLGHNIDRWWKLHGRPPRQVNATQIDQSYTLQTSHSLQNFTPSMSFFSGGVRLIKTLVPWLLVAHTSNSSVCFSHSCPLSPRVFDSGASDHVTDNKGIFSSLSSSGFLPSIANANGSQTQSQGIETVQILSSLDVTYVLYVSNCPFNLLPVSRLTRSLNCLITFTNTNVTLQDRTLG